MFATPNVAIHVESMGVVSYQKVSPGVPRALPCSGLPCLPLAVRGCGRRAASSVPSRPWSLTNHHNPRQLYRAQAPDEVQGRTFPVFTAIITVDKGVVTVRVCVSVSLSLCVCLCVCVCFYV